MNVRNSWAHTAGWILICISLATTTEAQKITGLERNRAQSLLRDIAADVKKHYYDPKFHGLDWDERVRETKDKIEQADSGNKALSEIAALLDSLNDSHTYFMPPPPAFRHDYGWEAKLIGGRCYVVRVRPGSDAEAKGVRPGDEILGINGYAPTRKTFAKIKYFFNALRPQLSLRLVLRDADGKERTVEVATKIIEEHPTLGEGAGGRDIRDRIRDMDNVRRRSVRSVALGDELMILKLPVFLSTEMEVDSMIGKARKHKTLIIDLRENEGGMIETLKNLLGWMFENEVKIGDRVTRDERKSETAKGRGHCFQGKLIVLVDNGSASASELFARVVQIEKRGIVLGDTSSGRVMEAKHSTYNNAVGVGLYGASITYADVIMTDGKSLEQVGVTPDEVILPTSADLAEGRDPVLARAAEIAGVKLSPEAAGKLFPYEWPPQ